MVTELKSDLSYSGIYSIGTKCVGPGSNYYVSHNKPCVSMKITLACMRMIISIRFKVQRVTSHRVVSVELLLLAHIDNAEATSK